MALGFAPKIKDKPNNEKLMVIIATTKLFDVRKFI